MTYIRSMTMQNPLKGLDLMLDPTGPMRRHRQRLRNTNYAAEAWQAVAQALQETTIAVGKTLPRPRSLSSSPKS
jgi:hypothetical protein